MPMSDSKSDSVHTTELSSNPKGRIIVFLASVNGALYLMPCLWIKHEHPAAAVQAEPKQGCILTPRHVGVPAALALHNKISILSGLELKTQKERKKKLPVTVNESVVSRCLLLSFESNQNQGGNIEILSQRLSHLCLCQAVKIV